MIKQRCPTYNHVFNLGIMFGFIKEENDNIVIANRIFEMQLYNLFISEELLDSIMYKSAARDKDRNLFIKNSFDTFRQHPGGT